MLTDELERLGHGTLLYKVDVSRAFHHVKVDPGDYDLLRLQWRGTYVDTCLPFGMCHGSQIFQGLSDAVRFIMQKEGHCLIDSIEDYIGVSILDIVFKSFQCLVKLVQKLGLTIIEKKLISPITKVVCLGVLIDTEKDSMAIPDDKLAQINEMATQWLDKRTCTKRQLQSILGLLLYIHKCVKPTPVFLNRMLELLRSSHGKHIISLTSEFNRDLHWFAKFLTSCNGMHLYDHRPVH